MEKSTSANLHFVRILIVLVEDVLLAGISQRVLLVSPLHHGNERKKKRSRQRSAWGCQKQNAETSETCRSFIVEVRSADGRPSRRYESRGRRVPERIVGGDGIPVRSLVRGVPQDPDTGGVELRSTAQRRSFSSNRFPAKETECHSRGGVVRVSAESDVDDRSIPVLGHGVPGVPKPVAVLRVENLLGDAVLEADHVVLPWRSPRKGQLHRLPEDETKKKEPGRGPRVAYNLRPGVGTACQFLRE